MQALLKRILRICKISNDSDDSGNLPIQQVSYMGKTVDVLVIMPYGLHANIPKDYFGILAMLNAKSQGKSVIPISPEERPKNLASGDVVLYSPISGEKMTFKAAGGIEIDGDVTYNNNVTVNGDTVIEGNLTVNGDTELGATVTSNGVDISDTHVHNGSPTAPSGAISNTGVPI